MNNGPLDMRGTASIKDKASSSLKRIHGNLVKLVNVSGLARIARSLGGIARAAYGLGRVALAATAPVLGLTGAVAAFSAFTLVNSYAAATDELAKFGRQSGFTAQQLRELNFVGERQGVATFKLKNSLTAMTKRVGELRQGTGALNGFLKKTNPNLAKALKNSTSSAEAFNLLMSALNDIEDPADRAALAAAAFSRSGIDMVRIAEAGPDAVRGLTEEFRRLAGTMTPEQAAQAEAYQDSIANLQTAIKGLSEAIGGKLLPELTPLVNQLTEWVAANREVIATNIGEVVTSLAEGLKSVDWVSFGTGISDALTTISGFAEMIGGIEIVLIGVGVILSGPFLTTLLAITQAFWSLGVAMLATPVGRIIAGIALVVAAFVYWEETVAFVQKVWAALMDWISDTFGPEVATSIQGLVDTIGTILSNISDFYRDVWSGFGDVAIGAIKAVIGLLTGDLSAAFDGVKQIGAGIEAVFKRVFSAISGVTNGLIEKLQTLVSWAKQILGLGDAEVTTEQRAENFRNSPAPQVGPGGPFAKGIFGNTSGSSSLLKKAAAAGAIQDIKVPDGEVKVGVTFKNAPPGTRTTTEVKGTSLVAPQADLDRGQAYDGAS